MIMNLSCREGKGLGTRLSLFNGAWFGGMLCGESVVLVLVLVLVLVWGFELRRGGLGIGRRMMLASRAR